MDAVRARSRVAHQERSPTGAIVETLPRARPVAQDRRGGVAVRRPRPAVRHHDQRLAHVACNTARINASNPCSEYMYLDDCACNLASLNLRKFQNEDGELDVEAFKRAVEITILAQEIIVDNAKYPTEKIARQLARVPSARPRLREPGRAAHVARRCRTTREPGRAYAGAITALMCGARLRARRRRSRATSTGPFDGYAAEQGRRSSASWRSTAVTSTRSTARSCRTT